MQLKKIPKHINAVPQFLWWEVDDMMIFMFAVIIAMFDGQLLITVGLGLVGSYIHAKSKDNFVKGYFGHVLYYLGFRDIKGMPNSNIKEIRR